MSCHRSTSSRGRSACRTRRRVAAAREALARAREEIAAGHDPGDLVERVLEAAARRAAPRLVRAINATGIVLHTNLGRAPLAAAALERVAEVAGRLLESRVRPGGRRARLAARSPRGAAAPADGRRGRARRQQQRRRGAARARRARRRPRGDRLARRADRDRRRLSHPRRARAFGRAPARGRHDEPHACRRLRRRGRAGDGGDPARAPVELPRGRVHGAPVARAAGSGRERGQAFR